MVAVSQRVPRLRVIRSALAPLANVLGAQHAHIYMPAKVPCMGCTRKDECDISLVACRLG